MDVALRGDRGRRRRAVALAATSSATARSSSSASSSIHRSAYQLKEADPHSWAIPRLSGAPKAALVEIQADEYGGGRAERVHAHAVRATRWTALGLDATYGAYLDAHPGGHAGHREPDVADRACTAAGAAAIVGHLALFEMTSSLPNAPLRARAAAARAATRRRAFFDEHVEADAVHENIAAVDLAGGLARAEPQLTGEILWGARALVELEARWARHLLESWDRGVSSLWEASPSTARA